MRVSIYVFTSATYEERARADKWTHEDFVDAYNYRTTNEPYDYKYFAAETEALEAWQNERANAPYRQQGNISELVYYEVLELECREYDIEAMPETIDEAVLRRIVDENDIIDVRVIDIKISEGEE